MGERFKVAGWLLLAIVAGCLAEESFIFNHEICSAGVHDPNVKLNCEGDKDGGIFIDNVFECQGRVESISFHALYTGVFYADTWDLDHKTKLATLMSSIKITVTSPGYQVFDIPVIKRPYVETGYVLGVHYQDHDGPALLSWECPDSARTKGVKLSRWVKVGQDKDLQYGQTISVSQASEKRGISLKFHVIGPVQNARLSHGRRGRVEVKMNGEWGTICDKWFETLGWPNLFCYELHYPGAKWATYTNDPEIGEPGDWRKYVVPWKERKNFPISLKNPRCKKSDGINFAGCDTHPKANCNHKHDVYVECLPKVRCGNQRQYKYEGKDKTTFNYLCVPEVYEDGVWGYISESNPDLESFAFNNNTWMAAFCRELGMENVMRVKKAIDQPHFKAKYSVLRCDPKCRIDEPQQIANCPPGPFNEGCTVENVPFIQCTIVRETNWKEIQEAQREAKRAEVEAAKAKRQAEAIEKRAAWEAEAAKRAAERGAKAKALLATKNAAEAARNAEKARQAAERAANRAEFEMKRLNNEMTHKLAKVARQEARKTAAAAQKAQRDANQAQRAYNRAFEQAERLPEGPRRDAALQRVQEAEVQAQAAAKAAAEVEAAARAEAEKIIAAAEKGLLKEIKAAEREGEKAVRLAEKLARDAERRATAAVNNAERVRTQASRKAEELALKAMEEAAQKAAEARARMEEAERIAEEKAGIAANMKFVRPELKYEKAAEWF